MSLQGFQAQAFSGVAQAPILNQNLPAAQPSSYGLGGGRGTSSGQGSAAEAMHMGPSGTPATSENYMRGDFTGDLCVAIDLWSHSGVGSAIW
jgi:hypothetical protein